MSRTRYLYFIGATKGEGPVKIGIAASPWDRLRQLQTASWEELGILGIVNCKAYRPRDVEAFFHRKFAAIRVRGEWFERTSDLMIDILDYSKPEFVYNPVTVAQLNAESSRRACA
jgi:hypothetical protein